MQQLQRTILVLAAALLLAACGGSKNYRIEERAPSESPLPTRALVVDFKDERGMEAWSNSPYTYIPIFVLWGGYSYDRQDESYKGVTEDFKSWFAKDLTRRLKEAQVFESVTYAPNRNDVERGSYDVIIDGTLLKTQAKGGRTRYGLSFIGDLLRDLGLPESTRYWVLENRLQLLDGYTFEPLETPRTVSHRTDRKIFNKYGNRQRIDDLAPKMNPLWDEYIAHLWDDGPKAESSLWAEVRTRGQEVLEAERREAEFAQRGSPPTFAFLSPADGQTLRTPKASLRWSLTAPGGLRSAQLTINGEAHSLGAIQVDHANPSLAPVSLPATDVQIPLAMGANAIQANVLDHRGNSTQASLSVTRLPAELNPAARHALLIGGGTATAAASLDAIAAVLGDPLIGQFPADNILQIRKDALAASDLESAIRFFSRTPKAGELAFVYVQSAGTWDNLSIGSNGMPVGEFVDKLRQSLATEEVILVLDVAWSGATGDSMRQRIENAPARWAFFIPNPKGETLSAVGGRSMVAEGLASTMRGAAGDTTRLTLERFIDDLYGLIYRGTSGAVEPEILGRYNPSITMVERE